MSTIKGTITGVTLVRSSKVVGARKTYLCTVDFPAYTGAGDSGQIDGVAAAVQAFIKNGKTLALCAGAIPTCAGPGIDTAGQAVYIGTTTISTNDITFNLTNATNSELTSTTGVSTGVELLVPVVES